MLLRNPILLLACSLLVLLTQAAPAQTRQRIRGVAIAKDTRLPIARATATLTGLTNRTAIADTNGYFVFDSVTPGKYEITVVAKGYARYSQTDLNVISAREAVFTAELEEQQVTMQEVTIVHKWEHINDLALASTKTFDVQETERYAGSRGDPARMASNYAGVQGGNDTRNDIVIRGNSPQGVVWRLEGVDIPNPNHFGIPGTTGGPVTMLNNKTLANSDFFTGAFPASYGNGVAGVFDLRLRNGNNQRHEFTAQLGFLGTELAAEGPLSRKNGSSYLVAYRYSTLQLFEGLHVKIGTSSVPRYQDLTFKLHFPLHKNGYISVFGIGGKSNIDLIVSKLTQPEPELYGESDRDQYFTANAGTVGAAYQHRISSRTYTRITIAQTGSDVFAAHYKVYRDNHYTVDSLKHILGYDYQTYTTVAHWLLTTRIGSNKTLSLGILNNWYQLSLFDSSRQYPTTLQAWQHRSDFRGGTNLAQAYAQCKWLITTALTVNAGLHAQYLSHNGSAALEPRISVKWLWPHHWVFTGGYGLHSQMQPVYQYFAHLPQKDAGNMHNYNVGFTRSHHLVGALSRKLSPNLQMRLETYYQFLFNIPIETRAGSSYSALNQGSGYSRDFPDTLKNTGTGYNYGLELTLEKPMSHHYYALFTASVFDAKAKGNDGIYRKTDFNTTYAANLLVGYERPTRHNGRWLAGGKITIAGGRLYSPIDSVASLAHGDAVVIDSKRNTLQLPAYFRADIKLGYRANNKKVTHEVGLDLVNLLNTKNTLTYSWSYDLATQGKNPYYYQYQLGFLPLFYYRIDFGAARQRVIPAGS
ncbi:MAG: hypothetical protein EBZ77_03355 [Chitinophagia bacterium]|nr:hypothetical protein [Chitinophagia bacterium]